MNSDKANKKEEVSVDKKLANLLLLGWTMLADTCPVETCKCPLMRSLDGKKYCCGCEAWENSAKIEKQEFKEIASNNIRKTKIEKEQQPKEIVKEEDLDFLAESAFADACRPGNPKDTSVEEIKELYKSLL